MAHICHNVQPATPKDQGGDGEQLKKSSSKSVQFSADPNVKDSWVHMLSIPCLEMGDIASTRAEATRGCRKQFGFRPGSGLLNKA
jgi:hypothetical protein